MKSRALIFRRLGIHDPQIISVLRQAALEHQAKERKEDEERVKLHQAFKTVTQSLKAQEIKLPDIDKASQLLVILNPMEVFKEEKGSLGSPGSFQAALNNPTESESILLQVLKYVAKTISGNDNHPLMDLNTTLQIILRHCIELKKVTQAQSQPHAIMLCSTSFNL